MVGTVNARQAEVKKSCVITDKVMHNLWPSCENKLDCQSSLFFSRHPNLDFGPGQSGLQSHATMAITQ